MAVNTKANCEKNLVQKGSGLITSFANVTYLANSVTYQCSEVDQYFTTKSLRSWILRPRGDKSTKNRRHWQTGQSLRLSNRIPTKGRTKGTTPTPATDDPLRFPSISPCFPAARLRRFCGEVVFADTQDPQAAFDLLSQFQGRME